VLLKLFIGPNAGLFGLEPVGLGSVKGHLRQLDEGSSNRNCESVGQGVASTGRNHESSRQVSLGARQGPLGTKQGVDTLDLTSSTVGV
jgi:hypothetical protein